MSNKHQDFQNHTCSGNVGTKITSFDYGEGKSAKKFRMASSQGNETFWYDVLIYDPGLAAILEPHLKVGRRVVVTGKLKPTIYEGKNGPVISLQLRAAGVNFMDIPADVPPNKASANGHSDVLLNFRQMIMG